VSTLARTPAQLWQRARGPLLVAAAVLLGALVLALLAGGADTGRLDPRSPAPSGSRALAEVLRDQGVQVDLVTTTSGVTRTATAGDTVLVVDPGLLVPEQVDAVTATAADVVVVAPVAPERFAAAVTAGPGSPPGTREPGCDLASAVRAGTTDAGGRDWVVAPGTDATLCYAEDGRPSVVRVRDASGRDVTLLGSGVPLTNRSLGKEGNAALALGLLGENPRLVWYLPSLADVPAQARQDTFYDLVPGGIWWGLLQLGIAVLLVALWRARRLGPVVAEPLPVVVRASETVEGRARLYRRAGARDTAAEALRTAARDRTVPLLGLPSRTAPSAVVDAVAARTRRSGPEVAALLYGAAPDGDAALVRLADALDALEREVRRP
jgi:hypothetical protein